MRPGPLLMPPWRRERTDGGARGQVKSRRCRAQERGEEAAWRRWLCGNGEDTRVDMFIYSLINRCEKRWLVMLTGLMGCWRQGQKSGLWDHAWGVCRGQRDQMICHPELGNARWGEGWGGIRWWMCFWTCPVAHFQHLDLWFSAGHHVRSFRTLFSTWANAQNNKNQILYVAHCGLPLNTKVAYKSRYVLVGLLCEMTHVAKVITPSLMTNEDSWT